MEWGSKEPPLYVWEGDTWYNERDKLTYKADLGKLIWHHYAFEGDQFPKTIPFPPKTKVLGQKKSR